MKQINISLEERQYQWIKDQAKSEGKSISQIIRELIDEKLHPEVEDIKNDPIFKVIGMGHGEGQSIAKDHDDELYSEREDPGDL